MPSNVSLQSGMPGQFHQCRSRRRNTATRSPWAGSLPSAVFLAKNGPRRYQPGYRGKADGDLAQQVDLEKCGNGDRQEADGGKPLEVLLPGREILLGDAH